MKKESIENVLDKIGIPINLDGYYFLVTACFLKDRNFYKIGELYQKIADIHYSTPSKVERSIRYIHNHFNIEIKDFLKLNCKINNSVLIETIFRKVKRGVKS